MRDVENRNLLNEARAALKAHLTSTDTLVMATLDADGWPHASYAPFIRDADGAFVVFVSDLSQHTANLKRCAQVSILLIEDEQDARDPFARRRLTMRAGASLVARDHQSWERLADALQQRFGSIVEVLRGLGDFHLMRLQPTGGSFVTGYGKAFELTGEQLDRLTHLDETEVKRRNLPGSDA
jgi:putative heme iron utilization protein